MTPATGRSKAPTSPDVRTAFLVPLTSIPGRRQIKKESEQIVIKIQFSHDNRVSLGRKIINPTTADAMARSKQLLPPDPWCV